MTTITTEAFVDGRWTTQSFDVAAILQGNVKNPEVKLKLPEPPFLGVLTQTVIESPAVHWVLPITLQRNSSQHVASIGVSTYLLHTRCLSILWVGASVFIDLMETKVLYNARLDPCGVLGALFFVLEDRLHWLLTFHLS